MAIPFGSRSEPKPTGFGNPAWRKWVWGYIRRTRAIADKTTREKGTTFNWDTIFASYSDELTRDQFYSLVREFVEPDALPTSTPSPTPGLVPPVIVTEVTPPITPRTIPGPDPATPNPDTPIASPGFRMESTILQFNQNGQPVIGTETTVAESKFPWWILAVAAAGMFILRKR